MSPCSPFRRALRRLLPALAACDDARPRGRCLAAVRRERRQLGGRGRRSSTSFYPIQFATQQITGGAVPVSVLTKPGAEPHDLELSPQDIGGMTKARLVVYADGLPAGRRRGRGARRPGQGARRRRRGQADLPSPRRPGTRARPTRSTTTTATRAATRTSGSTPRGMPPWPRPSVRAWPRTTRPTPRPTPKNTAVFVEKLTDARRRDAARARNVHGPRSSSRATRRSATSPRATASSSTASPASLPRPSRAHPPSRPSPTSCRPAA